MTYGTDVSEWQGEINWSQVAAATSIGVYRVGNGARYDHQLVNNRNGCQLCEVSGSYWFFARQGSVVSGGTVGSWQDQVAMWLEGAQFQNGQIAQADIEGDINASDQSWLLDACHSMADYLQVKPFVYTNLNFAKNVLTDPAWREFPIWGAWPNGSPGVFPQPFGQFPTLIVHQYGYTNLTGINGPVDADYTPLTANELRKQYGCFPVDPIGVDSNMPIYRQRSDGAIFEIFMGYKFHCDQSYYFGVLGGAAAGNPAPPSGIVAFTADDASLNALPDWPGINPPSGTAPTKFIVSLTGTSNAVE